MKTLAFLFLMSLLNTDTASLTQKEGLPKSIVYEAFIETVDGSLKHGFVTDLDDSSITVSKKIETSPFVEITNLKYTDIDDIKLVRLKGSRAGNGLLKGALIGFSIGAIAGLISGDDPPNQFLRFSAGSKALILGILTGFTGLVLGLIIGAFFKKKYRFKIAGNKENFDEMLSKLKLAKENK